MFDRAAAGSVNFGRRSSAAYHALLDVCRSLFVAILSCPLAAQIKFKFYLGPIKTMFFEKSKFKIHPKGQPSIGVFPLF